MKKIIQSLLIFTATLAFQVASFAQTPVPIKEIPRNSCNLPAPSVLNAGVNLGPPPIISWEWPPVAGAASYVLKVKDLTTGTTETYPTNDNAIQTDAIAGHTYLGTVAAVCPNGATSPNVATRTVQVVIIDVIVQYNSNNCGFENGKCTGTPAVQTETFTTSTGSFNFNTSYGLNNSRQVFKFKISENTNSNNFVELKIAFNSGSAKTALMKTGGNLTVSIINQNSIRVIKGSTTVAVFTPNNFNSTSQATSCRFDVSNINQTTGCKVQYCLCKTCSSGQ